MRFRVSPTFSSVKPFIPGIYGVQEGYVYAIVCEGNLLKIGSSTNPRARIGEQISGDGYFTPPYHIADILGTRSRVPSKVRQILLSSRRADFRKKERALQQRLSDFRFGADCRCETFVVPRSMAKLVRRVFESDFSETLIAEDTGLIPKLQEAAA